MNSKGLLDLQFKKETNIEKQCPYLQLNLNSYIIGLLKGDL